MFFPFSHCQHPWVPLSPHPSLLPGSFWCLAVAGDNSIRSNSSPLLAACNPICDLSAARGSPRVIPAPLGFGFIAIPGYFCSPYLHIPFSGQLALSTARPALPGVLG